MTVLYRYVGHLSTFVSVLSENYKIIWKSWVFSFCAWVWWTALHEGKSSNIWLISSLAMHHFNSVFSLAGELQISWIAFFKQNLTHWFKSLYTYSWNKDIPFKPKPTEMLQFNVDPFSPVCYHFDCLFLSNHIIPLLFKMFDTVYVFLHQRHGKKNLQKNLVWCKLHESHFISISCYICYISGLHWKLLQHIHQCYKWWVVFFFFCKHCDFILVLSKDLYGKHQYSLCEHQDSLFIYLYF